MRIYKKEKRQIEETVLVETRCDLCGELAKFGNWDSSVYEINETDIEVTIKQKDGKQYPESGWGTEIVIDLCPKCFKNRLVPWLNSQGANIDSTKWDW